MSVAAEDTRAVEVQDAQKLLERREFDAALLAFGQLLDRHQQVDQCYAGAAQALLALVLDRPESTPADPPTQAIVRLLIHQESSARSPGYFHEAICSRMSSMSDAAWRRLAKIVVPLLRDAVDRRDTAKNAVLMLLLVREYAGGWFGQREISALHLQWLGSFSFEDMTLPYNVMFSAVRNGRNRRDILALLASRPESLFDREMFSLPKIALVEWLAGSPVLRDESQFMRLLAVHGGEIRDHAAARAAAKYLIVKHARVGPAAANHATGGVADLLADVAVLASSCAERRDVIAGRPNISARPVREQLFHSRMWQGVKIAENRILAAAPLRRLRRRPLVAICVSGQLRGYRKAVQTWQRRLLPAIEHEIFVDSWVSVGRSGAEPFRYVLPFVGVRFTRAYREACAQAGFDEVKRRYPALFSHLFETGIVSEGQVAEVFGTDHVRLDDDRLPPFASLSNQQKMHMKIQSCVAAALESGRKFDLIVRIRPDKPVLDIGFDWNDAVALCRRQAVVLADHAHGVQYGHPMIGDQFALGSADAMREYSRAWTVYPEFAGRQLFQCPTEFIGHASLAHVCWMSGISVRKVPMRFGLLEDPEALPASIIRDQLMKDAAGRMDAVDRLLLEAISADAAEVPR